MRSGDLCGGKFGRFAVLAHFDPDSVLDPYLNRLVTQLASHCQEVYIVSTSGAEVDRTRLPDNVTVVQRPNRGYDFGSYKVGILRIPDLWHAREIIVVNDSFYTTRRFDLARILASMDDSADIWALCESWQITHHLQSYFLLVRRAAIRSGWMHQYLSRIHQVRDKMQLIVRLEIGLTQSAKAAGLRCKALHSLSVDRMLANIPGRLTRWHRPSNPSHRHPDLLAAAWGVVKVDLLRLGIWKGAPGQLFGTQGDVPPPELAHLERTRARYEQRKLTQGTVSTADRFVPDAVLGRDKAATIAVALHLFFVELTSEFVRAFARIPFRFDLYISICDHAHMDAVIEAFRPVCNQLHVYVVENRGRDVRPFLAIASSGALDAYTCVLKLHGKKSAYSAKGNTWRTELLNGLIGEAARCAAIIDAFMADETLGIAAPAEQYVSSDQYWGGNRESMKAIARRMGAPTLADKLFFVAGTMFWYRPKALNALVHAVPLDQFEPERGQRDATMAHAFERMVCLAAQASGFRCAPAEHPTESLDGQQVRDHRVAVLA